MMSWIEIIPLNYSDPGPRTMNNLLKRAYGNQGALALKPLSSQAGLNNGQIDFSGPADFLPMKIMDQASRQKLMAELIAEILADRNVASIHRDLWDALDELGKLKVTETGFKIFRENLSFDRLAAIPPSTEYYINDNQKALERIVNKMAVFQDSAMFRFGLARRESRVARIEYHNRGQGTGWLVGPDLLLTAYHVISPMIDSLNEVRVRFDYKVIPALSGRLLDDGRDVGLAEFALLASSDHAGKSDEFSDSGPGPNGVIPLDFALLRLDARVGEEGLGADGGGDERRGHFQLPVDEFDFNQDEGLLILGHPKLQGDHEAGPLKLTFALPSEARLTQYRSRVRYRVNTEGGNSGSPVMDQAFNPVALHHAGNGGAPDWDCNLLWPYGFNQGIPLNLIVTELRAQLEDPILEELQID